VKEDKEISGRLYRGGDNVIKVYQKRDLIVVSCIGRNTDYAHRYSCPTSILTVITSRFEGVGIMDLGIVSSKAIRTPPPRVDLSLRYIV